jgi:hypothetical protein
MRMASPAFLFQSSGKLAVMAATAAVGTAASTTA